MFVRMTILIRIRFEPRDMWVGAYFKRWRPLDVYLCPIPSLAIRVTVAKMENDVK